MSSIIELKNVSKAYNGLPVLRNVSLTLRPGEPVCVTGASGIGKTTLLRLVLGLEKPDEGSISAEGVGFSAVFQEDRLLDAFDAVENLRLAAGIRDRALIKAELRRLLPEDAIAKPVRQLSGGQRRRVCIVRALLAPSDAVVMDEPFAGLDAGARAEASAYIREKTADRILLLAAHEADVPAWSHSIIKL